MCEKSILHAVGSIAMVFPYYLNAAAVTQDPIERMKLVMVSSVAFIYPTHMFQKPLNPILGETLQQECKDGTKIYCEQTTHHPPITSYVFDGPDNLYSLEGWNSFTAKAWMNSITLTVAGKKTITFKDGGQIEFNNQGDQFNSIFIGTINHQLTGKIEFHDKKNGLYGYYDIGNIKKKP